MSFIKGTELRNLLFYSLPAHLKFFLCPNAYGHFLLFTCAIRLLHSGHLFGERTCSIAETLLQRFHSDHDIFFNGLKSFKLHLHSHLTAVYENYGSLSYLGCFGQESLIGFMSKNYHQVRNYGDAITYFFNIDFVLNGRHKTEKVNDGPRDRSSVSPSSIPSIIEFHSRFCRCEKIDQCCTLFRRCIINERMFHSLLFLRRQNAISYFVTYSNDDDDTLIHFGIIECFFIWKLDCYAIIKHHPIRHRASYLLKLSPYYELLKEPIDRLYYVLEKFDDRFDIVDVTQIRNHCIIVEKPNYLFASAVLSYDEHD